MSECVDLDRQNIKMIGVEFDYDDTDRSWANEPKIINMGECEGCDNITNDVEEYCHHCGNIYCFECLDGEWCYSCLFELGDEEEVHV